MRGGEGEEFGGGGRISVVWEKRKEEKKHERVWECKRVQEDANDFLLEGAETSKLVCEP